MSVDALQEKVRKMKNALMVDLNVLPDELPPHLMEEEGGAVQAYARFCRELLPELKGKAVALRFHFSIWSLLGADGIAAMKKLMKSASSQGFYVLLDAPEMDSPRMVQYVAELVFGPGSEYKCDGIVVPSFPGSDWMNPFLPYCKDSKKDIFCLIRGANKSASELQDLLTGSRLVHLAAADRISRYSGAYAGKFGYSRMAVVAAASSAESLRSLRGKYPGLFILADGLDYPGANLKNAALAFDKMGRGAVVCAGTMVTCAWKKEETDGKDFAIQAGAAAEKIRKNLLRYTSFL